MKFTNFSLKVILVNLFFLSIPFIGLYYNLTQLVFLQDISHMALVTGSILLIFCFMCVVKSFNNFYDEPFIYDLKFFSKISLFLGLVGTVIGLSVLVHYLKFDSTMDAEKVFSTILNGISDSLSAVFYPTLVGLAAKVMTEINIHLFKKRELLNYLKGSGNEQA